MKLKQKMYKGWIVLCPDEYGENIELSKPIDMKIPGDIKDNTNVFAVYPNRETARKYLKIIKRMWCVRPKEKGWGVKKITCFIG